MAINLFEIAQRQFDKAADVLKLSPAIRGLLREPMKELHFNRYGKMEFLHRLA